MTSLTSRSTQQPSSFCLRKGGCITGAWSEKQLGKGEKWKLYLHVVRQRTAICKNLQIQKMGKKISSVQLKMDNSKTPLLTHTARRDSTNTSELAVKFGNKHRGQALSRAASHPPLSAPHCPLHTKHIPCAWGISFSCPSPISNYDAGCTVINFLWDTRYIEHMNVL